MVEEEELVEYLEEVVKPCCPLNTIQLKLKVVDIAQTRMIPFKNGRFEKS